MSPSERADIVQRLAAEAGFERVGVARAQPIGRADYFHDWLSRGYAGDMNYLQRLSELRTDPRKLLEQARSVIVVAHNYHQGSSRKSAAKDHNTESQGDAAPRSRIAQYAWGKDYHGLIRDKLRGLVKVLQEKLDEPFDSRICVDSAPIIEREVAAAAGIGWIGKNTMVLHQQLGSFFFLGEIITTLDLEPTPPVPDRCGSCTRCLEACPTGALIAPHQMDARKCIAYLTIEHREDIPEALQPLMGNWVFGCDACQEVCPYNKKAPITAEPAYKPSDPNPLAPEPALTELMDLTEEQHEKYLVDSAMERATLSMLHRNAAIAYGNWQRYAKNNNAGSSGKS